MKVCNYCLNAIMRGDVGQLGLRYVGKPLPLADHAADGVRCDWCGAEREASELVEVEETLTPDATDVDIMKKLTLAINGEFETVQSRLDATRAMGISCEDVESVLDVAQIVWIDSETVNPIVCNKSICEHNPKYKGKRIDMAERCADGVWFVYVSEIQSDFKQKADDVANRLQSLAWFVHDYIADMDEFDYYYRARLANDFRAVKNGVYELITCLDDMNDE